MHNGPLSKEWCAQDPSLKRTYIQMAMNYSLAMGLKSLALNFWREPQAFSSVRITASNCPLGVSWFNAQIILIISISWQ